MSSLNLSRRIKTKAQIVATTTIIRMSLINHKQLRRMDRTIVIRKRKVKITSGGRKRS